MKTRLSEWLPFGLLLLSWIPLVGLLLVLTAFRLDSSAATGAVGHVAMSIAKVSSVVGIIIVLAMLVFFGLPFPPMA